MSSYTAATRRHFPLRCGYAQITWRRSRSAKPESSSLIATCHRTLNMGLVEHLHPMLESLPYEELCTQVTIVGLGFLAFTTLYVASHVAAMLVTHAYVGLSSKEKVFWNLAVVRGAFGVFSIVVGIWNVWWDAELIRDIVYARSATSWFVILVATAFFAFECAALLVNDIVFRKANTLLNVHHWLAFSACLLVLYYGSSHYLATLGLLLEMSTPFTCLSWVWLKCGLANSRLWKANQMLLVHLFHLRSVLECFMWMQAYRHWERIWTAMPWPMLTSFLLQLTLVTFVMTPYWTYKKTEQLVNGEDWNFAADERQRGKNVKSSPAKANHMMFANGIVASTIMDRSAEAKKIT